MKEFCTLLLGQKLKIYTEHKNIICIFFKYRKIVNMETYNLGLYPGNIIHPR